MTDGRTSRAISEAFVDAALDIRCRACDGKGRVPAFWYGRWRECMACGGTGTSRAGQAARVLAEADTLRRELDKARAEADVLVQQVGVEGAMRAAAEAQAARYQEALERIAEGESEHEWRDAMDAAETWWRKRTGHYRPALEQITARYIAGASAGELADIAFEALRGRDK